jgi:anaerobic magnesium-protoporphyrin IX monomethyl ester cyclase
MNVVLLNPPFRAGFSRPSRSPGVARGGTLYYPIWLSSATGVLEAEGFSVRLLDAVAEKWTLEDVLARIRGFSPRLIVLETSTPSIFNDVLVAETLKAASPGAFVVLVGTHVSALAEETLRMSEAIDAVARREYDETLKDVAIALRDGVSLESLSGLSFRRGQDIIRNPDRPFIENLDALPFVSATYKKHLDMSRYFFAAARHPMVMIMTGRGCPYRCTFCVYPQTFHGRRYRSRSPENVVSEFEWIVEHLPEAREVGIEDDTFTADRPRAKEICRLLIQKKVRIPWYCNVRPDLDFETLCLMKEAGCRLVTAGFESGTQAVLEAMDKGLKVERMREFAENARKAGILVHGCIVIGHPGETRETVRASLRFARSLRCDSMQFYPLYVYPGTTAYSRAKEAGYLETEDFSRWVSAEGYHNCVLNLPGLPAHEILAICDKALRGYHFSPSYLGAKFLQGLRRPAEGVRTARSAWRYVRSLRRRRS